MSDNRVTQEARQLLSFAQGLGFDAVNVSVVRSDELAVRVAHSIVCRENVLRDDLSAGVSVVLNNRRGYVHGDLAGGREPLEASLRELRGTIASQREDKEYVPSMAPAGKIRWERCSGELEEVFPPAAVYAALNDAFSPVRAQSLQGNGFVKATMAESAHFSSTGHEFFKRDLGIAAKMVVSDGTASGVGYSARHGLDETSLSGVFAPAVAEAMETCLASREVRDPELGDVTVILSPSAVRQLLLPAVAWYNFLDRRTVDEGRTWMSHGRNGLRFPQGLTVSAGIPVEMSNGKWLSPVPFNSRGTPCRPLHFVREGEVQDLLCEPFWARKMGVDETYSGLDAGSFAVGLNASSDQAKLFETEAELIASTKRAIYVKDLWYIRLVSAMDGVLTGMTRDGVFEVRDGKMTGALRNLRWHVNPFQVLANLTGATRVRRQIGSGATAHGDDFLSLTPTMRFDKFHFSSVTRF